MHVGCRARSRLRQIAALEEPQRRVDPRLAEPRLDGLISFIIDRDTHSVVPVEGLGPRVVVKGPVGPRVRRRFAVLRVVVAGLTCRRFLPPVAVTKFDSTQTTDATIHHQRWRSEYINAGRGRRDTKSKSRSGQGRPVLRAVRALLAALCVAQRDRGVEHGFRPLPVPRIAASGCLAARCRPRAILVPAPSPRGRQASTWTKLIGLPPAATAALP